MARRRNDSDDEISLFPFLSIIACVIGVLTMMIATLSLAQTDTPDVAQIEKHEDLQKQLNQANDAIKALKLEISVSKSSALELREQKRVLDVTVSELQELLAELEEVEKELAEQQAVEIIIPPVDPKTRETASDMQEQAQSLQEELAQLEQELAERKESGEANVTVLPQGSGLNFTPHFVECAAESIVLHTQDPPKRIRSNDIPKDQSFLDLLQLVANGSDDTIIFLIRSDSLSTYQLCKRLCDAGDIRNGKLPVVGQGRIDLSAFNKKRDD